MTNTTAASLRLVLYSLLFSDNIASDDFVNDDMASHLAKGLTRQQLQLLKEALQWSAENPGYPYNTLLPGLNHSSKDIHTFLRNLASRLL